MPSVIDLFFQIRQAVRSAVLVHPHSAFFIACAASLLLLFIWLREAVLKPPHKRKRKDGTGYRLPSGPRGIPILGNLLQLKEARDDVDHKFVSWIFAGTISLFYAHISLAVMSLIV